MANPEKPKTNNKPRHADGTGPFWTPLRLGWICAGCVAGILVILLLVSLSLQVAGPVAPEKPVVTPAPTPDRGILVQDLYEGNRYVPRFSVPKSTVDPDKFTVDENGLLHYDSPNADLGVDVSEFQDGPIDWEQVKAAGIEFCILRAGYRGLTEGLLNRDETFADYYSGAREAGLKVGVYFFSQAVTAEEAREEADFVLELLEDEPPEYPIVFDWEPPTPSQDLSTEELRAYGLSGKEVTDLAVAFCDEIQTHGCTPCVYLNKTLAYEFFDLDQLKPYDLWYAEYQPAPSFYYSFRIWQYASDGQVPGIPGTVDMDICFDAY